MSTSKLHLKPTGTSGKVFDVTPETADWEYVGFGLYHLSPGEKIHEMTDETEVILVLVEGKAEINASGQNFGEMGERMDVFEKTPPHCLYVPNNSDWSARATTNCVLAVCKAPGKGTYPVARLGPDGIDTMTRGTGSNMRYINNIAMEGRDVADSLLVTEVFTPQGNWSSYPSHRHDEDNYPDVTYLEESYYHRLNPASGFGFQRIYTEDRSLNEAIAFEDGDLTLVPRGHHPCGAPYGYELYYLNVMAGPLRKWRFINDPAHDWIYQRDLKALSTLDK